jgi:hypothetical protein
MRSRPVLVIVIAVLALLAIPANAARPGGGGLMPLSNPEREMQKRLAMATEPAKSPYPMTYSEQVAQSLGLRKDGISLYGSQDNFRNPYAPSVSLGGPMLRLRWRQ